VWCACSLFLVLFSLDLHSSECVWCLLSHWAGPHIRCVGGFVKKIGTYVRSCEKNVCTFEKNRRVGSYIDANRAEYHKPVNRTCAVLEVRCQNFKVSIINHYYFDRNEYTGESISSSPSRIYPLFLHQCNETSKSNYIAYREDMLSKLILHCRRPQISILSENNTGSFLGS
jgi:hypothetical protein